MTILNKQIQTLQNRFETLHVTLLWHRLYTMEFKAKISVRKGWKMNNRHHHHHDNSQTREWRKLISIQTTVPNSTTPEQNWINSTSSRMNIKTLRSNPLSTATRRIPSLNPVSLCAIFLAAGQSLIFVGSENIQRPPVLALPSRPGSSPLSFVLRTTRTRHQDRGLGTTHTHTHTHTHGIKESLHFRHQHSHPWDTLIKITPLVSEDPPLPPPWPSR